MAESGAARQRLAGATRVARGDAGARRHGRLRGVQRLRGRDRDGCRRRMEVGPRAQRRRARLGHRRQAVQGPQPDRPGRSRSTGCTSSCSASARRRGRSSATRRTSSSLIPLGAFQRLFGSRRSLEITVKPVQPELRASRRWTRRASRCACSGTCGRATPTTSACHVRHADEPLDRRFSQGAFAILIGVVSLSLVVGGIVIMNIMLMVVSERTREIGLRKALGAKRRDIVWQILTESTTLSMVGGLRRHAARLRRRDAGVARSRRFRRASSPGRCRSASA